MKLEIKKGQLVPYLPYDLPIEVKTTIAHYVNMTGITRHPNDKKYFMVHYDRFKEDTYALNCYVKPILRPLSDLTKEWLKKYNTLLFGEDMDYLIKKIQKSPLSQSYKFTEHLFKNHYDVFGLIEKGLAIDKNTLK